MPRQARLDALGLLQHVMARGIERRKIFRDDKDRASFLERFAVILEETQTQCYAWALIPNHFHLLLRTGPTPLSKVMRRLMTGYAVTFNKRHKRSGHLFQNRYKSVVCEEDPYLLELIRYIHLNPLRAGLVKDLKELDKYPWTGHSAILGRRKNSLLPEFGNLESGIRNQRTPNKPGKPDSVKGSTPSPSSDLPASPEGKQWRAGGGFLPREIFTDVKRRSLFHWGSFSLSSGKGKKQHDPDHPVNPACPACPVAPADGTGVAPADGTGVQTQKVLAEKTIEDVLLHFGETRKVARRRYRQFVKNGIGQGKRPELQGGGLVRSSGGTKLGLLGRKKEEREKGDQRILGSGDFVTEILKESNEVPEDTQKIPIEQLANKVIEYFGIKIEDISGRSQKSKIFKARAIICYFAIREMRYPGTAVGKFLKIRRYSALRCADRGKKVLDTDKRLWELVQI